MEDKTLKIDNLNFIWDVDPDGKDKDELRIDYNRGIEALNGVLEDYEEVYDYPDEEEPDPGITFTFLHRKDVINLVEFLQHCLQH